jgi:hypothetical protein
VTERFDLGREAPLRVGVDSTGTQVVLAGHHAALDGLGMAGVLAALLQRPIDGPGSGTASAAAPAKRHAFSRADRVAASAVRPASETLVGRPVMIAGPSPTARLAAACAAAAADHNARLGARWERVGISLGIGGRPGIGNTATYCRVDVPVGAPVAPMVVAALAGAGPPVEHSSVARLSRLLMPLVTWFSDSILVSNLGRLDVPATSVDFFPVARGRSAVSFGAAGVADGSARLTIRARDLDRNDSIRLLEEVIDRFESVAPEGH